METIADLRQHIRKRLAEIDDLEERKAAKEILLEGLIPIFEQMEKRYLNLENQIRREIHVSNEKYAVAMTVIEVENYDPINGTLYPVVPELLTEHEKPYLIYFSGNYRERADFERAGEFQGTDEHGNVHTVKVRKANCYQEALANLYQVFVYNKIKWTTVNTAYLDRFYEVTAEDEAGVRELCIDFGDYGRRIKHNILLLWNIEKFKFQCRKFMVPCIDEKYYEHELNLKNYDPESGYMLGINEDVLKIRHEKDKIIMTSLKESFRDWEAYRFAGETDTASHGYTCEVLGNARKESFFHNYKEQQESLLGSRTELFSMVQSFENNPYVDLEECEILERSPQGCLEGNMNPFIGDTVFPVETRKTLVLYFAKKGHDTDFCEDMVRFFVSQMQLSVCEYKCIGILR